MILFSLYKNWCKNIIAHSKKHAFRDALIFLKKKYLQRKMRTFHKMRDCKNRDQKITFIKKISKYIRTGYNGKVRP